MTLKPASLYYVSVYLDTQFMSSYYQLDIISFTEQHDCGGLG